jgi:hypothetical protein
MVYSSLVYTSSLECLRGIHFIWRGPPLSSIEFIGKYSDTLALISYATVRLWTHLVPNRLPEDELRQIPALRTKLSHNVTNSEYKGQCLTLFA